MHYIERKLGIGLGVDVITDRATVTKNRLFFGFGSPFDQCHLLKIDFLVFNKYNFTS